MLLNIGVVGSSQAKEGEVSYQIAYEVGRLIAQEKAALICGGMTGIMEAAAKGCYETKGVVVGILGGIRKNEANSYLTIALPTGLRITRNSLIAVCSDALIAISGGAGTLSEITLAIKAKKPVIAIRNSGGICSNLELLGLAIKFVDTEAEAVSNAVKLAEAQLKLNTVGTSNT